MTKKEREEYLLQKLAEMKSFDQETSGGCTYIAGVDEVGRGPLAGPVVTAAVVLPPDFNVPGIDDSKKLTEKKREALFELWSLIDVFHIQAFIKSLCHRFHGAYIDTSISEEAFVKRNVFHHHLGVFRIFAGNDTSLSESQLTS